MQTSKKCLFQKGKSIIKQHQTFNLKSGFFVALFHFGNKISSTYEIAGYLVASVMTLSALLIRYYNYKIIITTKNQDIIKTNIEPEYKDEARELISHIKQNIKPQEPILRAI